MNLNENSFLYKYLTLNGNHSLGWHWAVADENVYVKQTDSCSVIGAFISSTLLYAILLFVSLLAIIIVGDSIGWFASCIVNDFACYSETMSPGAILLTLFTSIVSLVAASAFIVLKLKQSDLSETTLAKCIIAKKEKICIPIRITND